MQLDHDRFMEDGFLILPGFIGEELDEMRMGVDVLVQLSQAQARDNRKPDEPIGGKWHAGGQPRVIVERVVTEETAYVADYFRGLPMQVSTELLGATRVGLGQLQVMVSSVLDFGVTDWHRDYTSRVHVPLAGVQMDQAVNGPPYVQWNIALYDDDVFWVVPGSHRNPDSEGLKEQLLRDPKVDVPGSFQANLKAGDAIVYASYMLHWGSPYTSRMRRVIHTGYYDFDKISSFGHHPHYDMDLPFTKVMSAETHAWFEQQVAWTIQCRDLYERLLRTALDKDGEVFAAQVAQAHPEESCRMVTVAHLCRMAEVLERMIGSRYEQLTAEERREAESGYGENFWADFKSRFTREEADALGQRFALMTDRMLADRQRSDDHYTEVHRRLHGDPTATPNYESRPLRTHYHEMADLKLDELISSW